jgi:ATP-dependent RNA helicase RhlE
VAEGRKVDLLQHLLGEGSLSSAIVFTRTKHRAKRLAQQLDRSGHRAVALQGNMSQSQRDRAMRGFRERRYDVLVATDIAARGIDVSKVSHVINFDVPVTPDAYTHRIGRTGRAENEGKAFTFVTGADRSMIRAIERVMGAPIPRRELPGLTDRAAADAAAPEEREERGGRGPRRSGGRPVSRRRGGRTHGRSGGGRSRSGASRPR